MRISLTVNGDLREIECLPHESLKTVLRREGFFSVRFGAETGETGAAAVLVDGRLVSAEIMLAAQADGRLLSSDGWISSMLDPPPSVRIGHGAPAL